MKSIDDVHIRRLDLTLLIVFETLLQTRNMSATAIEIGLTQSAVSHAVARLRSVFDDPLFVRKGAGVEPTPRARLLGPPLSEALAGLRDAIRIGQRFDPGVASRQFAVAAPDTVIAELSASVLNALGHAAPHCRVMFRVMGRVDAAEAVVAGEVDLALGAFEHPPEATIAKPIRREAFRIVSRRGHPAIPGALHLDAYCALDHLLVSSERNAHGAVDAALAGLGRRRRIAAVMPQMLLAFAAVSRSDAIFTAPLSACAYAASVYPLAIHQPPLAMADIELALLRRRDGMSDPALAWLAELVAAPLTQSGGEAMS